MCKDNAVYGVGFLRSKTKSSNFELQNAIQILQSILIDRLEVYLPIYRHWRSLC